jgi:hypothetical protein
MKTLLVLLMVVFVLVESVFLAAPDGDEKTYLTW